MTETKPADAATVAPGTEDEEKHIKIVEPGQEQADQDSEKHAEFQHSVLQVASVNSGVPREKYGNPTQFLMSCIASAVGLGNVWRFPAVCARNGGAAFLLPYLIVLTVIARPLFVLELSLGQFSSKGSVRCWDLCPLFRGIGFAGMVSSVLLSTFYIMLMAWSLLYSGLSVYSMFTKIPAWGNLKGGAGAYFGEEFLHDPPNGFKQEDIGNYLSPLYWLILALIAAWLIIWVSMVFGVETSGKVAYVTALAPYFVLVTLLIIGFFLDGFAVGYEFLFVPQWNKLLVAETWFQAVGQCFFSLGIGFGGCIMFSSFNNFHHDIMRDVLIVSFVDLFTSVLAGCSLMSILGFEATKKFHEMGKNATVLNDLKKTCERGKKNNSLKICVLEKMVGDQGGAGLAFVHNPEAMIEIQKSWGRPWGGLVGLLFFLMLILLAVGSANGFVGTTITIICDMHPKWKRKYVVSGVCAFSCFLGLIYTNGLGSHWFDVIDIHGVTAVVYILSCLEVVTVMYVYGLKNWCNDMEFMRNGRKVGWYLRITWVCLPFFLIGIFIVFLVKYKIPKDWTVGINCFAWIMTVCCLLVVPGVAIHQYFLFKKNPWRRNVSPFMGICKPSPRWGPKDPEIRTSWRQFKSEQETSYFLWERFVKCISCKKGQTITPTSTRISFATKYDPTAVPDYDNLSASKPEETPSKSSSKGEPQEKAKDA